MEVLQVYQILPTPTGIKGSKFEEVQTLQNIGRQGSITFHITVDKNHFLDPYCTFMYIELILKSEASKNMAKGAPPRLMEILMMKAKSSLSTVFLMHGSTMS